MPAFAGMKFEYRNPKFETNSSMSGLEIARIEMKKLRNKGIELTILLDISNN